MLQITTNELEDYAPSWSPDGKEIAFVTVTADPEVIWYSTNHLCCDPIKRWKSQGTHLQVGQERGTAEVRFQW